MSTNTFDVIVIGGGVTGSGTARDCSMRGLKTLLVERHDIATGATGRNHGLLHSGARYAVSDPESARECILENRILKKIARHCIEETSGLFLSLPEDDLSYQDIFVKACGQAGIKAEVLDPKEALRLEPSANPLITGAVRVPDGAIDPFRLCASNMMDAKSHGCQVRMYTEVTGLVMESETVIGVKVLDHLTGQPGEYYGSVIVNACGIWGHAVAGMAGIHIGMVPAKGSLLVFAHRVNDVVLNRCRRPANADILVPGDTVSVIGTTSTNIEFYDCDSLHVTPEEVNLLLEEGAKLAPVLNETRILRAYAGVRPLVSDDSDPSGRNISRGIVCLDHEVRDGVKGFVTITGGKLVTYRLMAELVADLVCRKLGHTARCMTAEVPLPGSEKGSLESISKRLWNVPTTLQKALVGRAGGSAKQIPLADDYAGSLVCECEEVSVSEVDAAIENLEVHNLLDLRRRTRVGMGTCQGELCAFRVAGRLAKAKSGAPKARADLKEFLNERWKGMYPVAWGDTLRESAYTQWVYSEILGIGEKL